MGWISVDDRLPEAVSDVWGHQIEGRPVGFSDTVIVWPYDPGCPESMFGVYASHRDRIETVNGGVHAEEFRTGPITHWMPLPSPPTMTEQRAAGFLKIWKAAIELGLDTEDQPGEFKASDMIVAFMKATKGASPS